MFKIIFLVKKYLKQCKEKLFLYNLNSRYNNVPEGGTGYGDHQRTYHHVELNSDAKIVLEVKKI